MDELNKIQKVINKEMPEASKEVLLVIDGYQYLLDTFLADEVLKQTTTDPTVISKMIKTTEELGNMNLQSVLDLFNMQDVLSKDSGNTLSRKRVK